MKIGIYCGVDVGQVQDQSIDYIGVDAGVSHLIQYHIHPLMAIGDMDSLDNMSLLNKLKIKKYSPIKDDTDTALALKWAFENGYDEIDLYGVTQKRMDHFLAVLCLLEQYKDKKITIYDSLNKIFILNEGKHIIPRNDYHYFSLFALDESLISLKNCQYPLDHYLLKRNDPLCVSNQMIGDFVFLETSSSLIFIQSN